jgi:hypothetical protein
MYALSGIRTNDPSVRESEDSDSSCLRPRGYCDRQENIKKDVKEIEYECVPDLTASIMECYELTNFLVKPPVAQLLKNFPTFFRTPRVHYRIHKSLSLIPILPQINPIHTTRSHLSKMHFNIVVPHVCRSSPQNPLLILILPRACYMPCSSHPCCNECGSKSLESTQREISEPVVHLLASVLRGWLVMWWGWESLVKQNFLVNWISTNLSTFRPLCTIVRYSNTTTKSSRLHAVHLGIHFHCYLNEIHRTSVYFTD